MTNIFDQDITDKYPLLREASDEINRIYSYYLPGEDIVGSLKNLQSRACRLIEDHIDRPEREKEKLMVSAAFYILPPAIAADYGPIGYGAADPLIKEAVFHSYHTRQGGRLPLSTDFQQICIVSDLVARESALKKLLAGQDIGKEKQHFLTNPGIDTPAAHEKHGAALGRMLYIYEIVEDALQKALREGNSPASAPNPQQQGPKGTRGRTP
jgi:hypothetical protein